MVLSRLWSIVSLGRRYLVASVFYVGLGLILGNVMPDVPSARASGGSCGPENPCGSGEICCVGTCVPDTYVCCEDGTSGPGATCICCSPGGGQPTSVFCE
jgi:hypothetical protein